MRKHIRKTRHVIFFLAALLLLALAPKTEEPSARPCPIVTGRFFLHGGGPVSNDIRDKFIDMAGGPRARIVVIPSASRLPNADKLVMDAWKPFAAKMAKLDCLHITSKEQAEQPDIYGKLADATGVWISGGDQSHFVELFRGTPVADGLKAVLARGGIVGGTSAGASCVTSLMVAERGEDVGMGFLNDYIIDQHFDARHRLPRLSTLVEHHPDHIGIGINCGTALLICNDIMSVLGGSGVTVCIYDHGPKHADRPSGSKFRPRDLFGDNIVASK